PFADTSFLPLLAYMGLDLFSDSVCEFYGYLNIIMTPSASYNLEQYPLMELNTEELIEYNKKTLALVIKEIYENIKNGTLRNLVEQRSCSSPAIMSTLRILDKEYISFLEKYTPIH
ncbi:MAG: archaeosine tRNA-ribosyltransferase, partial [Methanobacterium sp.]|nr:archaeosine tRNA-ribosyltransferase [Methanobacterium sp.]